MSLHHRRALYTFIIGCFGLLLSIQVDNPIIAAALLVAGTISFLYGSYMFAWRDDE